MDELFKFELPKTEVDLTSTSLELRVKAMCAGFLIKERFLAALGYMNIDEDMDLQISLINSLHHLPPFEMSSIDFSSKDVEYESKIKCAAGYVGASLKKILEERGKIEIGATGMNFLRDNGINVDSNMVDYNSFDNHKKHVLVPALIMDFEAELEKVSAASAFSALGIASPKDLLSMFDTLDPNLLIDFDAMYAKFIDKHKDNFNAPPKIEKKKVGDGENIFDILDQYSKEQVFQTYNHNFVGKATQFKHEESGEKTLVSVHYCQDLEVQVIQMTHEKMRNLPKDAKPADYAKKVIDSSGKIIASDKASLAAVDSLVSYLDQMVPVETDIQKIIDSFNGQTKHFLETHVFSQIDLTNTFNTPSPFLSNLENGFGMIKSFFGEGSFMLDPYGVLGISREASAEEIKAARANCIRAIHPDYNPETTSAEFKKSFDEINAAANFLLSKTGESKQESLLVKYIGRHSMLRKDFFEWAEDIGNTKDTKTDTKTNGASFKKRTNRSLVEDTRNNKRYATYVTVANGRTEFDEKILCAMEKTDRKNFVPINMKTELILSNYVYVCEVVKIGYEQTCSNPGMVAAMADILNIQRGHNILEIGTGCGYAAAITYRLLGPLGKLTSIEIIPELHEFAKQNLKADLGMHNIQLVLGNGCAGYLPNAKYNGIYFTAGVKSIDDFDLSPLEQQLTPNGKILIPEGAGGLYLFTYHNGQKENRKKVGEVAFVPLKEK